MEFGSLIIPDCCICCEKLIGNNIVSLTCGHVYHHGCIMDWLARNNSCCTCRSKIVVPRDVIKLIYNIGLSNESPNPSEPDDFRLIRIKSQEIEIRELKHQLVELNELRSLLKKEKQHINEKDQNIEELNREIMQKSMDLFRINDQLMSANKEKDNIIKENSELKYSFRNLENSLAHLSDTSDFEKDCQENPQANQVKHLLIMVRALRRDKDLNAEDNITSEQQIIELKEKIYQYQEIIEEIKQDRLSLISDNKKLLTQIKKLNNIQTDRLHNTSSIPLDHNNNQLIENNNQYINLIPSSEIGINPISTSQMNSLSIPLLSNDSTYFSSNLLNLQSQKSKNINSFPSSTQKQKKRRNLSLIHSNSNNRKKMSVMPLKGQKTLFQNGFLSKQ